MRYSSAAHTRFYHRFPLTGRVLQGNIPRGTSFGSQNTTTTFCRVRCESGSARSSARPATNWASISCAACWPATTCTCSCRSRRNCRCPMSCSASRAGPRGVSKWSFQTCASATGEGGFSSRACCAYPVRQWGARVLLDHVRKCDPLSRFASKPLPRSGRYHHAVPGITFR